MVKPPSRSDPTHSVGLDAEHSAGGPEVPKWQVGLGPRAGGLLGLSAQQTRADPGKTTVAARLAAKKPLGPMTPAKVDLVDVPHNDRTIYSLCISDVNAIPDLLPIALKLAETDHVHLGDVRHLSPLMSLHRAARFSIHQAREIPDDVEAALLEFLVKLDQAASYQLARIQIVEAEQMLGELERKGSDDPMLQVLFDRFQRELDGIIDHTRDAAEDTEPHLEVALQAQLKDLEAVKRAVEIARAEKHVAQPGTGTAPAGPERDQQTLSVWKDLIEPTRLVLGEGGHHQSVRERFGEHLLNGGIQVLAKIVERSLKVPEQRTTALEAAQVMLELANLAKDVQVSRDFGVRLSGAQSEADELGLDQDDRRRFVLLSESIQSPQDKLHRDTKDVVQRVSHSLLGVSDGPGREILNSIIRFFERDEEGTGMRMLAEHARDQV